MQRLDVLGIQRCRDLTFLGYRERAVVCCHGIDMFAQQDGSKSVAAAAWHKDLIVEVTMLLGVKCVSLRPDSKLKMDSESAEKNFVVLSNKNLNWSETLLAQKGSSLDHSPEFKPVRTLKSLFGYHPDWYRMETSLKDESDWPMEKLDPGDRISHLKDALSFVNHKGATN
jgi:hypothetical protein